MEGSGGKSGGSGRERRGAEQQASVPNNSEFAGMGLQLVVAIVLFLFLGKWIDSRFGTTPLFMIVGVFVGAGGATFAMYRRIFPPAQNTPPAKKGGGKP
jgi:F0F1-type ATP synthase assembly protein I